MAKLFYPQISLEDYQIFRKFMLPGEFPKKRAIVLLGGKVAATHSTEEVVMLHAMQKPVAPTPTVVNDKNAARQAFRRRRAEREARP
jgi:hypothetical protein